MKYLIIIFSLCLTALSWAEFEADKHTVALWHFNKGEGDVLYDVSGNKNHGRISGATWSSNGIFGGCLLFDGSDDYVEVPSSNQLVPNRRLTLEAWVKIEADLYRPFAVIEKIDNYRGGSGYTLDIDTDGKFSSYLNVTDWKYSNTSITLNEWVYLAITFDGEKLRYYINGEETDVFDTSSKLIAGNDLNLIIGRTCTTNINFFQGSIDEIRISSTARTSREIKQYWLNANDKKRALFIVYLKNGDRVSGEIVQPSKIVIDTKYGDLQIPIMDILSIDFDIDNKEDIIVTASSRISGKIKNDSFKLKSNFGIFKIDKKRITKITH